MEESSVLPQEQTFKEIRFNMAMEEQKMKDDIQKTIDKFMKKKHQMIKSLQKVKVKEKKSKNTKNSQKSSKVSNSFYQSRKSSKSQKVSKPKSPDNQANNIKTKKSKSKKKTRKNKKLKKKKELAFYESEMAKERSQNIESTQIKTERDSVLQTYNESQKLEDMFAPLNIKRTHIDSNRNTGLLCKSCLEKANRNQNETSKDQKKGVEIPHCQTENCVNNKAFKGVKTNFQGIDERLDQAIEESLLGSESEIFETGFGKERHFEDITEESQELFVNIKESSIINEEIEQMGNVKSNVDLQKDFNKGPPIDFEESFEFIPKIPNPLLDSISKDDIYQSHISSGEIPGAKAMKKVAFTGTFEADKKLENKGLDFLNTSDKLSGNQNESKNLKEFGKIEDAYISKDQMSFGILLSTEKLDDAIIEKNEKDKILEGITEVGESIEKKEEIKGDYDLLGDNTESEKNDNSSKELKKDDQDKNIEENLKKPMEKIQTNKDQKVKIKKIKKLKTEGKNKKVKKIKIISNLITDSKEKIKRYLNRFE